jgi:hypothetical protein
VTGRRLSEQAGAPRSTVAELWAPIAEKYDLGAWPENDL